MKIQIVQIEIEEAVRDFIRKQINVKEGMEITMDFSATRGADGLTAAIDISPAGTAGMADANAHTNVTTGGTTGVAVGDDAHTTTGAADTTAAPATRRPRSAAAPASAAEKGSETGSASGGDGEGTASSQLSAGAASDEPEEVAGEAPLKPSIFGNLRRPSNSEDTSAEAAA